MSDDAAADPWIAAIEAVARPPQSGRKVDLKPLAALFRSGHAPHARALAWLAELIDPTGPYFNTVLVPKRKRANSFDKFLGEGKRRHLVYLGIRLKTEQGMSIGEAKTAVAEVLKLGEETVAKVWLEANKKGYSDGWDRFFPAGKAPQKKSSRKKSG
jgi:hypothetical protein